MADISIENSKRLIGFGGLLVLVLIAFFAVKTVNEIKRFSYIGDDSIANTNSISVSGEGEVFATADIASFTYSVIESGKSVSEAENKATAKWNDILNYLKQNGIAEKDVKTISYQIDPQYAPLPPNVGYVPLVERDITGYTVTQSASVKVRDTSKVGEILSGVGDKGVRNLSDISFTIDDESALKAEAQEKAIADAKSKANALAKSLGVRLGGVMSYYEVNSGYPMYSYAERSMAMDSASGGIAVPQIPMGENRIVVNVEITYRIK